MMNEAWRDRIVAMVYVKQQLMKLDVDGIWPHHLPELAATDETLRKTEALMGSRIDQDYREFLNMANGWKGFLQTVDLFGTQELSGSQIMQYTQSLLGLLKTMSLSQLDSPEKNCCPLQRQSMIKTYLSWLALNHTHPVL